MRCLKVLMLGGLLSASSVVQGEGLFGNEISIGMGAPSPTGLSLKLWTSRQTALGVFSNWAASNKKLETHIDYLTHNFEQFEMEGASMPLFYGFGLHVRTTENTSTHVGFRLPVGVSYLWDTAPLDFFAEVAPRAGIIPETSFALDVMIGVRYRIIP